MVYLEPLEYNKFVIITHYFKYYLFRYLCLLRFTIR